MDYLSRDAVDLPESVWEQIDQAVVNTARKRLIGRQFLSLFGPLGPGATNIHVDQTSISEEVGDGVVKTVGRRFTEIPQLFEDFTLLWRDIENSERTGFPLEFSPAMVAAQALAKREDELIFFGNEFLGQEGLLNASGITKISKSDWTDGENAFIDVASGLSTFRSKGIIGNYYLILSPDLFVQLQRIQPALGMMEADRINKMLGGNLINAPVLGSKKAVLVCAEPQYMDLAIGSDMATGYLETENFNHVFRIMETAVLRIKCKDAIITFE